MDDDNHEGPFPVWEMFNVPFLVLFNNLESAEEGLVRLLNPILKSSEDFTEVIVPRPGSVIYPDTYYSAFNNWLIGRLFYLWSVEDLKRIHISSKNAQLKILNLLGKNGATFFEKLHTEYYSIVTKLVQYYKDNVKGCQASLKLENFIPEQQQIVIPNVQLNLEHIFVEVKDIKTCITLIELTLQLLADSIPANSLYIAKNQLQHEELFTNILYMLKHYSADLKLISLKFFSKLITNFNEMAICNFSDSFSNIFHDLLCCLETMTKLMAHLFNTCEVDTVYMKEFSQLVLNLLKHIEIENNGYNEILLTIAVVVLSTKGNHIFTKELKLYSLSLSKKIVLPKDLMSINNMDMCDMNMLTDCYCQNILSNIDSSRQVNKSVNLKDNWHYNQLLSVIDSLKSCEDMKTDMFLMHYHLQRCQCALDILLRIYISNKKLQKEQNLKKSIILLEKSYISGIWKTLIKSIEIHKKMILEYNYHQLMLNITLNTVILSENITGNDSHIIIQLLCLQSTSQFSEHQLQFNEIHKAIILKYILVTRLTLKFEVNESWYKIISFLLNTLLCNKAVSMSKEVISLCPLLLINKVYSASELIGDILMRAFLTNDQDIQKQICTILSNIACLSLGTCSIAINTTKDTLGHSIFSNTCVDICLVCTKCHNIDKNITSEEFLSKFRKYNMELHFENKVSQDNQSTTISIRNLFDKFLNVKLYGDIQNSAYWSLVTRLSYHFYLFNNGPLIEIINEENIQHVLRALRPYIDSKQSEEYISHHDEAISLCVNSLAKFMRKCLEFTDHSHQKLILSQIKEFGLCCNDKVVFPAARLLVYFIIHPQCPLAPIAVVILKDICESHGYTPNQVYHRYKTDLCKLFVVCSLYNGKVFAKFLLAVVKAFGFTGYRDFISKDIHHFLPYLIPYSVSVKEVPSMIEEIASLVQCSVSDLLIEKFPHIYVHIYLSETSEVARKCYNTIEKLTKMTLLNLIKKHFRIILSEFLLQYCCNPGKVLDACRYLAYHDPDVSTPTGSMSMSTSQIADFLNLKFLGVLAYFDHKLVNVKVALSVKRKALKSFADIMQLMEAKYLTPMRYKVLATLRSALPLVKEFPKILAEAWRAFIYNIDSISLGPLLSNLAISLLQQFEYAPHEINKIFQHLILNNENLLSSHLSDLFFLEDTKISEEIKMVIKKHVKRKQPDGFLDKIKWYLQHLNQEIPRIKAYAFSLLDKLLKSNRTEIHKAIFGGKHIDPVIVELVDALLSGCKDPDSQVSMASGACLGQLGAIEAGHLPRQYVEADRSIFAFSLVDNCFAATALVELTRAFFQYEKNTTIMDCYALTIQEILKMYDISPTGRNKNVWESFPEHMHQIMYPLLSSRYTLAYPAQPKKAHPLFGSLYATTFLEWIHNWTGQLISLIDLENIRELLRTVYPSMRRDVKTLFLFLPYVLLHAVMSKSNTQYIQEEMLAVIGLEKFENESVLSHEHTEYKMLRHIRMTPSLSTTQNEEGNQNKCSKMIYTLLDFLNRWVLQWCHSKQHPLENENYKTISSFIAKFDKLTIARGNFLCGELERALQYLEMYMDEQKDRVQEELSFMAEIYALLDEPDSVAGILSIKRSEPSLKELILAQVVTGRLQDAALCYERLAQQGQLHRHTLQGMIDCYLSLDQPFVAYRFLSELNTEDDLDEFTAEPLWRLGRWEELDKLVKKPVPASRENWGLLMGRVLLSNRKQDHDSFVTSCDEARRRLLAQLDGQSKGENALRSGYQSVLGLHIISEAGHAEEVLRRLQSLNDGDEIATNVLNQLLDEWRRRLALVQSDARTVEPLLRLRRTLLQQTQELLQPTHPMTADRLKSCIGDLWLQSAKYARKAGILQQSHILNAEEYRPEELFIEKAKMYWSQGQHEHAFTTLRRGLDEAYPCLDTLAADQRKICAKAKLLFAKYNDETTNVDVDVNIGYYKESVKVFKEWENSLVCLGAYYEKVSSGDVAADSGAVWTRRIHALNSYGKALQFGHKYLYQSMPRMLSIWLDVEVTPSDTSIHSVLAQMTEIIKTYSERLPLHLYLTAFSQIISRICHPVKEVYLQLKAIIVKLILAYPQHTLWMMMCVIKSGYPQRIKRCADLLSDPRLKESHIFKLVNDFKHLAEKLIELCNKPIASAGSTTTVSALVRTLPNLLASDNFSHIMMPFQEFCKIVLPSKAARQEKLDFNIPYEPPVYIAGIEEEITILPSLQKPRKVTLKGSDGKSYIIMLKPRDDLRKDFRLMEFNGVVNRFLQDAPETRKRRLYIRTYSVLPLNEECGLIEWVPNLIGLRPVLMHIYKQKGIHTTNRELKEMMCSNKDPVEKKRRIYEEQLLRRHPPVFQEWFRRVFSDPYGWYQARSAYIRTTAVMSMVGYILGLGDRHGENILFDSTNGDTVHVDFNCLFNKGESFEWPERVPFRLTHNMEAAMGPLKHEGMYRKSCEAVMRVLRGQTAALMSVVGPFVYDPLLSWGRASRPMDGGERTNEQALQNLLQIRQRLNGMVRTKNKQLSLSLSPEGQVEHLIAEAVDIHNLCQMYIGWGPFL